jgi:DNA-directed RNA polymerase specialized sigma24 family protein
MSIEPLRELLPNDVTRRRGDNVRLLTQVVFTTLNSPMTETRRAGTNEAQHLPSIRPGIEGYADGMQMFPRLKEWENQIALHALREGKTVQDLRNITPFRQYLGVAKRAHLAGENSQFSSFTTLFAESPSIDLLVSLGNFHTIHTWTWTLAKQYPGLHLPLEQFFQEALYQIAPSSSRNYDPSFGNPFHNFLATILKKRFRSFVSAYRREITAPIHVEEQPQSTKGRPAARRERVKLASLDAYMHTVEIPQTLLEFVETTHHTQQDTTHMEDQEARDKIHLLAQLAGLNDKQEETLIALYVYGGDTSLIAQARRSTTRSVRGQRQIALERIQELGYERVNGILTGRNMQRR